MSKRGRTRAQASRSSPYDAPSSETPSLRGRGRVLRARSPTNQPSSSSAPPVRGRGRVVRARIEETGRKQTEHASEQSRSRNCLVIVLFSRFKRINGLVLIYRRVNSKLLV